MNLSTLAPTNKKVVKCLSFIVVAFLIIGIMSTAQASTEHGEGDDRYVLLNGDIDDTDGNWATDIQLNISVPEELGTRSSIDGTITYNMTQSADGNLSTVSPAFWANTTVSVQGQSINQSTELEFEQNDTEYTKDISLDLSDANLNESDDTNDTISITFETESNTEDSGSDLSTSDSWSGEVKLVEHMDYIVTNLTDMLIALMPLFIVVGFVIPLIMKIFEGFGGEFDDL